MTKTTEAIVIIVLMIISFFIGVKYSDSVKTHMGWISETSESDIELPDLTEGNGEVEIIDEAGSDVGVAETAPKAAENNFSGSEAKAASEANQAVQP